MEITYRYYLKTHIYEMWFKNDVNKEKVVTSDDFFEALGKLMYQKIKPANKWNRTDEFNEITIEIEDDINV